MKRIFQKRIRGWKLTVPFVNQLDGTARQIFTEIANDQTDLELVTSKKYEIIEQSDKSFGLAKRYSARILLLGVKSKAAVRQIIREVTETLRVSKYASNVMLKSIFEDAPASIVWLFVYQSLEDVSKNTWISKSQWIDPNLEKDYQPGSNHGEDAIR